MRNKKRLFGLAFLFCLLPLLFGSGQITRVTHMLASGGEPILQFSNDQTPLNTTDIHIAMNSGSCTIDWGDGNTSAVSGGETKYSHDYTAAGVGTYNIVIYGQTRNITIFKCYSEPISGDIAQFKRLTSLAYLRLYSTSVSGDIANLSGLTSLTVLRLDNTSVSGDIANLSGLTSLADLRLGSTSVDTYTQGILPDWDACAIYIQDLGLDQTEVDNFLCDLDSASSASTKELNIGGTNAAPSATGTTCKNSLIAKGWTVTTS